MRLNQREIACIEQAARESFVPCTRVSLFGSRLDDARRGGDIDLLIETPTALAPDDLVARRQRFISRLYRLLGEQRIDVLIVPSGCPDDRPVVRAARRQGCQLTEVK
ncbi:nucleotidyltransferase family protein [Methylotetracoccus oryzae]|uniref:nucleotidyltransferase domain-containing protein n=1 Tax=Methylotetracoccus oryzae TaxID=1919059 RepID=UPI00111BAD82|nr:nucleotidyltransferase domain-containing protein [Methylotetracoccus oryzae]